MLYNINRIFNKGLIDLKIKDIFASKRPVLSFEVFPPKRAENFKSVKNTVAELSRQPADYMSVTYGAGGSTSKRTAGLAEYMQKELDTTALAHLTCISSTRADIENAVADLTARGIQNILALRGDVPRDADFAAPNEYRYASELIGHIKSLGDFCVGGACYPEGHPDCPDLDSDISHLRLKTDAGADFLVTQMFFDNAAFYSFRDKAAQKGISVPITAGIMPLTNAAQIQRMCILSGGAAMPAKFTRMICKYENDPAALKQAGIAYAVDQIIDLISNDTAGIHLYTMNRPDVAEKITDAISCLI